MVRISEIIAAIEKVAPIVYQDGFDNSGLQVGFPDSEVSKVLVCLDVTEEVVAEAAALGCGLIVSHHPLIFKPFRQLSCGTYQQRCAVAAIRSNIAIYSAHTSLDNAPGGVNHRIAETIGLRNSSWLQPKNDGSDAGSGLIGELESPMKDSEFLDMLKEKFAVECLLHSEPAGTMIRKVALCGGAGAFLLPDAIKAGADCFVSGEFHYHDYFENDGVLLAELGHYQSEQYTRELLSELISANFPEILTIKTTINTNPIRYNAKR